MTTLRALIEGHRVLEVIARINNNKPTEFYTMAVYPPKSKSTILHYVWLVGYDFGHQKMAAYQLPLSHSQGRAHLLKVTGARPITDNERAQAREAWGSLQKPTGISEEYIEMDSCYWNYFAGVLDTWPRSFNCQDKRIEI